MLTQQALEQHFQRRFVDAQDNWKASCPFHDERTPSFLVHKVELIANCFGCGVSGHIDTLLAKYLRVDVKQARELLDIQIEEQLKNKLSREKKVYEPRYIPESWLAPWRKEVHQYVIQRGFSLDILRRAETRYDFSSKRQVFPHRDRAGKLLGCIGRACNGQEPKWYFYWAYDKGSSLYRCTNQSMGSEKPNGIVITEGVFDCLRLEEFGISAAATLGTKVTQRQIEEMREYEEVILAFDNDVAGRKASEEVYQRIGKTTKVKFVVWPEHTNDVMDIQGDLKEWIAGSVNYVQRQLV